MIPLKNTIQVIGFDADDTLWVNEPYYQETEAAFCDLLSSYGTPTILSKELLNTERQNIPSYGYGTKGFMLSMLETALRVSGRQVPGSTLDQIISLGKSQLNHPVELLQGVVETLEVLSRLDYRLVVATKGDLKDQERKLAESGLEKYFHHIEIMSDKQATDYQKLLGHLNIEAETFLMVGNSVKSDVLPVVHLGGQAVHIPYHTTWEHEVVVETTEQPQYWEIQQFSEIIRLLET